MSDATDEDYISSVVGKLTLGGKRYSTKANPPGGSSIPDVSSDEALSEWSDQELEADMASDPETLQNIGMSIVVVDNDDHDGVVSLNRNVGGTQRTQRRMSRRGSTSSIGAVDVDEPKLMDPFYRRNALFLFPVAALLLAAVIAGVVIGVLSDQAKARGEEWP